jgi:predicted transcriptional regulator
MGEKKPNLSAAELQVLRALWDTGPGTVRDVMNHLHDLGRPLAYTTVMTFLARLEQKGFVDSDKSSQAFVYRATVSRERVRKTRLKRFVSQYYDGAAGALVLQLVKSERLTADEIAELQRLIERLDTTRGSKSE